MSVIRKLFGKEPKETEPEATPSSFFDNVGLTLSGAGVMSGDDLAKKLMGHTAPCRRCSTPIEFQQGGSLAMQRGIHDKVVMCGKCSAIYEVQVSPQGMKLTADVTSKYG